MKFACKINNNNACVMSYIMLNLSIETNREKTMDAKTFQETLRVANCLSGIDFQEIFDDGEYYANKFFIVHQRDIGKFIMHLDSNNLELFMNYVNNKREVQNLKYA